MEKSSSFTSSKTLMKSYSFSMSFSVVSFLQALFVLSSDFLSYSYKLSGVLCSSSHTSSSSQSQSLNNLNEEYAK